MNPLTFLPANVRRTVYALYATLGVAFGAVQVGFATADVLQPTWLLVAFGVFGYLGTALGLVAAANVQTRREAARPVTIQVSPAADQAAVGRAASDVLDAYERRGGRTDRE